MAVIYNGSKNTERMPLLFIGHGSPLFTLGDNYYTESWKKLGRDLPRPEAVVCISAHWQTAGTYVTAMPKPQTIHDFGGFPPALYDIRYEAPGDPDLAGVISNAVTGSVISPDQSWGLDHGAWTVIRHIYPDAEVPVIEISLDYHKSPKYHYELGKELSFLRDRGILIIGSGNLVHNLSKVAWDHANEDEFGYDWALKANDIFRRLILDRDHGSLIDYNLLGSVVRMAVPSPDHFLPLLYVLGMQQEGEEIKVFTDKAVMGSLTMTSVMIG
jgi:4,5-DOPA dioxygenase extradiol